LAVALKIFLQPKSWPSRPRGVCAINARGVSVRKFSLPAGAKEQFHQRLRLQIESEFPLSPDELAWGYQQLGSATNGIGAKQDLLVAAVKKEVVADYQEVLLASGTYPIFTLAALARNSLCTQPAEAHALLDIGDQQSELTIFEKGVPTISRIIFWDGKNVTGAGSEKLDALAQTIKSSSSGTKIFISGNKISENFPAQLAKILGEGWKCERLEITDGKNSAAIAGLKKLTGSNGELPLAIRVKQTSTANLSTPDVKKWLVRAAVLIVALLLLPYFEALLFKSHLAKKVSAYQAEAVRLTTIEREQDFLRYLKQNQPPYLNALFVFSKSTPPGTHFDALTMNSHGEVSMRASFRDGSQVSDFRSKLIASGTFANVTVEEQTPAPNGQQVNVRMTAQWKPGAQWPSVAQNPAAGETGKNGNTTSSSGKESN
jgi:hypothetical protein